MRNLFKKSLTLCLVAILAFSCFAGIVSAETAYTATIAVDNQTITPGTTSVDVTLNITSTDIGINEALIEVSSPLGTIATEATLVSYTTANEELASIQYPGGSTNFGSFYLSVADDLSTSPSTMGSLSVAQIKVTFTVAENKAPGTYPINIKVDGVRAASGNEDVITFSYATANVTIPAPHVHNEVWNSNEDGTHTSSCNAEGCDGTFVPATEACADGDDQDTLCDKCNFDLAEEDVCVHENTEFYYDDDHEITAAEGTLDGGETAKGKIYFKCVDCDEIIEEEVSYYYYYTTGTQNATLKAEILYNFQAQPKHLNRQGDFQDAYFVVDMQKETGLDRQITNYADADYDDSDPDKPYYVVSMGVAAKEMTTAMVSTVFVKWNDQWWSGYQFNKKLVDYTTSRFNATGTQAATDAEKTMYADMLTFGAAAQKYYDFNLEDLATDYLGEYSSYVTEEEPVIEDNSVNGLLNATDRNHVGYHSFSLNLGSIIKVNLGFRTDFYKGEEDLGELSAVCSYIDNNGEPQAKTYTSEDYALMSGYTDRYEFAYDGIAAKDMRKVFTCTINNANGPIGFDLQTSIASVAAKQIASTSNQEYIDTAIAMIKYGDSASVYFAE